MSERQCGKCTACCTWIRIDAAHPLWPFGDKPAGVPCEHVDDAGCSLWPSRPALCESFSCTWQEGPPLKATDRPDRSGLIVHVHQTRSRHLLAYVDETRPGALASADGRRIVDKIRQRVPTRVRTHLEVLNAD